MIKNKLLEEVRKIEDMELELTIFNSKRALSKIDKRLEVAKIGDCSLLLDSCSPSSIYYNRIKGFGLKDLDKLEEILAIYSHHNITPCFDMTPNNINEEVSTTLLNYGYSNVEQLVFMQLVPELNENMKNDMKIVEVTEHNAEEFVNLIINSNGGMDVDDQVIERKKQYFYKPNFHNYIYYLEGEAAGMGSLFINGVEGYIANDFTFEKFREKGIQKSLLMHRINKAKQLGLEKLYTDVEFGSVSHNNMESLGFKTVFINSFWMKVK
jgi:hypothetical protein